MTLSAKSFTRRFRGYIVLTWTIPPVFGLSFLLFIRMFTPAQMLAILASPLEPVFIMGSLLFALWYFSRFIRPVTDALADPRADQVAMALARMHRFPLDFWGVFLSYLLLAPASVILSAERYAAFEPRAVDWFRIHLVALIVSIIVGLPIFFRILDLFGRALNGAPLKRPHLTIRTKVFLIGSLVPLLIDTMLVQYYWTRTGYFSTETFLMWLLLELLAIGGSLIFIGSFGQSLRPWQRLIRAGVPITTPDFSTLHAQSTDELGVLAEDFRELMERLGESEERFRATFSQAAVGIAHVAPDGRFLRLNQKFCDIAGYPCEELLKRTFQDITHPDDLDADLTLVQQVLLGKIPTYSMEKRYFRKDGAIVWVNLTVALVRDAQGHPKYFISVIEDISARKQAEVQMRQLSSAVEQTADSVIITDRNAIIQYVNQAFEQTTGFSSAEAIGKTPSIVKSGQHDADFYQRLWDTIERGETYRGIFTNRRKDGTLYCEEKTITPLKDAQGRISHFVATGKDITERMQALETLRASEASLANAQRIAHLGSWDWNLATDEVRWSDEVARIFGLKPLSAATAETFLHSVHPDDRTSFTEAANRAITEKRLFDLDFRIIRPDGTERIVHGQAEVSFDKDGKASRMVGTVQDITEQRHAQDRLNYLAYYDTLTGLPNRVLLQDRLTLAMREADRRDRLVAVMFLDLDRFKIINDTLGHDVGDALLQAVAERLKGCVRAGDTISRLGGDEFTVILANVAHVDDVARAAQKIIDSFTPPFNIDGRELFVSPSIGITLYPFDDNKLENLLRNADAAMYHAKELGRNTFQFYTAELNRRTAKRLQLETALRHALERNELLLNYQPQVDLKTRRIIGAEALLRWRHPEMGLMPPLDFIPLAEETGLVIPIGEWVLRQACAQAKAWHRAGFRDLQVAVNLSGRQFQHHDLAKLVKGILRETGLDPRHLDLELTESLLMHNSGETLAAMNELHVLGVNFSLDDFGTGYSSLSYLKRFPINLVKIDKSFVRDIPSDPNDAAIAQAVIAMAHALGARVIAEGVETAEQLEFLRSHDCDAMQGYYFSKPAPAEDVTNMLRKDHGLVLGKSTNVYAKRRE